jgi:cell division protein FtsW
MTRRFDLPLLFLTLGLVGFGLLMVYSASAYTSQETYGDTMHFVFRQGVAVAIGMVLLGGIAFTPYQRLMEWAGPLYGVALAALVMVWIPGIGHTANGATRWVQFGGFNFQPAEMTKLVVLVGLAAWLHRNRADIHDPRVLGLTVAGLFPPLLLIMLQPDFGSTLIICMLCGAMFFLAGLRWSWIATLGALGAAGLGVVMMAEDYRRDRITSFLDPFANCQGSAYQVCQSLLAMHHGGLTGQGAGEGVGKLLFLPEPHNDFIAAVVGEELGFVGIAGLILGYGLFAWRGFRVAAGAPDQFGRLLAGTFTLMIVLQALLNLGVVMSVVPPKGLVLPFLSYGSTAMMMNLAAVGVLLSVSAERVEATAPDEARAPAGPMGARA